jgi:hypothetical protein
LNPVPDRDLDTAESHRSASRFAATPPSTRPEPRFSAPARISPGGRPAAGPTEPAGGPRRLVGWACLAGAGLILGLAVLLPTQVYPRLAVLPADPRINQVQLGGGGTALVVDPSSASGVRRVHKAEVKITTNVVAAPGGSSDPDSVLWQLATRITVGRWLLTARVETVSLDRHTARPTNCCGDRLVTDPGLPQGVPMPHEGFVSFPFDLQKHSYPIWDVQLQRARPAAFIGEQRLAGFDTYLLRADTPFTRVGTQALPGKLFGTSEPSVDADSEYADQRTYWVEPATGSVIGLREVINQRFRYNGRTVTALSATLDSPPLSSDLAEQTRQGAAALPWLRERASYFLFPIGLLLLAAWGWTLRPTPAVPTRPDPTRPDPTRPDPTRPDPTRPDQSTRVWSAIEKQVEQPVNEPPDLPRIVAPDQAQAGRQQRPQHHRAVLGDARIDQPQIGGQSP